MREIVPAILPKSFKELEEKLPLVVGIVSCVQIDLCDGRFVQSVTWPFGVAHDEHAEAIENESEGMPFWNEIEFEFDLMSIKPQEAYDTALRLGASRVVIHYGSFADEASLDVFLGKYGKGGTERGSLLDVELGLAFLPHIPVSTVSKFIDRVDSVQVMGIEKIGFQGEHFTEKAIDLIKAIRSAHADVVIAVDGGVSGENAEALFTAGVNRLVVGSAIFGVRNASEVTEDFVHLAQSHV